MTFTVHPVPSMGAEDVLVAADGTVYTGTEDGAIWALDPGSGSTRRVADTGGRPLGIELLGEDLLVCDAERGLLRVSAGLGHRRGPARPASRAGPMKFCNNAAVAADGTIWFSDSSLHYGIAQWKDDFVQDTRTGRLVRRDADGTVTVRPRRPGLRQRRRPRLPTSPSSAWPRRGDAPSYACGSTGPRAGERDLLVGDLPGYPDNISRGSDGLIWVSLASPVDPAGRAARLGADGRCAARSPGSPRRSSPSRSARSGSRPTTTTGDWCTTSTSTTPATTWSPGSASTTGQVWMGSLHEPSVAVYDLA